MLSSSKFYRAFLLAILAAACSAAAQPPEWLTRKGEHTGAFFRLGLWGTPAGEVKTSLPGIGSKKVANEAPIIRALAGWSVRPGIALHVTLLDLLVPEDEGVQAFAWGPGITAYGPANVFGTATFGFSVADADGSTKPTGTRWMVGLGKEFQFWPNSGLGLMVTYDQGSWEDEDTKQTWDYSGPGFQFTWTWN